jgi:hypothetical protein
MPRNLPPDYVCPEQGEVELTHQRSAAALDRLLLLVNNYLLRDRIGRGKAFVVGVFRCAVEKRARPRH